MLFPKAEHGSLAALSKQVTSSITVICAEPWLKTHTHKNTSSFLWFGSYFSSII